MSAQYVYVVNIYDRIIPTQNFFALYSTLSGFFSLSESDISITYFINNRNMKYKTLMTNSVISSLKRPFCEDILYSMVL